MCKFKTVGRLGWGGNQEICDVQPSIFIEEHSTEKMKKMMKVKLGPTFLGTRKRPLKADEETPACGVWTCRVKTP